MSTDRNDEKRWSTNDIFDAWNAVFPESDQRDVALLVARLDDQVEVEADSTSATSDEPLTPLEVVVDKAAALWAALDREDMADESPWAREAQELWFAVAELDAPGITGQFGATR